MNGTIKSKFEVECKLYIQYNRNGRFKCDFVFLETITDYSEVISSTKALYTMKILPKS